VKGLGYCIQFGLRMSRTLDIFVASALLSVMSLSGYFVLRMIERKVTARVWVLK